MRASMLQKNTYRVRFTIVRKAKTQEPLIFHTLPHKDHPHTHQQSCLIDCSKCFQYCTLLLGYLKMFDISQDPSVPRILRMLLI